MYRRMRLRAVRPQEAAEALQQQDLSDAPQQPSAAAPATDPAATLACRTAIGAETLGADGKAAIVLTLLGLMFTVLARFGAELSAIFRFGFTGTGIIRV